MATYFDPYALSPHAPPPPSSVANFVGAGEFSGFGLTTQPPPPPRVPYNLWPSSIIDHHTPPPATTTSGGDMIFRRPSPLHQQGLSLSLNSSQQSAFSGAAGQPQAAIAGGRAPPGFILGSEYLKATQEVLDEVVNVGIEDVSIKEKVKEGNYYCDGSSGGSGENNNSEQLTTSQRQELQMKKSNLVAMLHEVEQRYKEYEEQMQIVIRSFEEAAGIDGARAYTWVALRTISKQFRSLKEAIRSQVKATSKRLGSEVEEYCLGAKVEACKLLRYNHNINMVHMNMNMNMNMVNHNNNAWRPQRGLPERAVTILRAWLFDHFLHPYPKDSDKVMLAKQTGLTRSQVSNWFINARVRLWKPMVEEMYKEEMKDQLHDGSQSHDENSTIKSKGNKKEVVGSSSSNNNNNIIKEYSSSSSHNNNNSHIPQPPHKKLGLGTYSVMNMMMNNDGDDDEDGGLISMEHINGSRYNYNNNFYHGSNNGGVSLTLGLPHDEFCGINTTHIATPSHAASTTTRNINNNYENSNIINMHHIHNNTKRFAASQSLIPDFVSLS